MAYVHVTEQNYKITIKNYLNIQTKIITYKYKFTNLKFIYIHK